ncbi:MAG: Rne/Rng family ribonuclease [Prevotellaceae bacterium]|jgi:ribonuclease G|nr:Rne/Rng family ribonuclease [Prevotellaceae bacterium]
MEKDIIIDVTSTEVSIALLENKRLIELNKEQINDRCAVGDMYLGRVRKLMPSLNAAFVDIGQEKDAFVHYLDLGLNFVAIDYFTQQILSKKRGAALYPSIKLGHVLEKEGKIADILKPGRPILVQVVKEPISTKGARLTSDISFAGRNMVLLPFSQRIHLSSKIVSKEERKRLERLIYSILPSNYGLIVRTAAEGKRAAVLDAELRGLIKKWEDAWGKMEQNIIPQRLVSENNRATTILRDLLNDTFSSIHINDEALCDEVSDYIATIAPEKEKIVKLYKGNTPIFEHFEVAKQIRSSFGRIFPMRHGAYLVIEHTEALHVIDVNSGIRSKMATDQEGNANEVNRMAAEEIVRQLRLRDMGGIIVIDFIDMDASDNRAKLFRYMQELMSNDRAKHTVLPLSKFGLMQITRQRVRPAMEINTSENCPACQGTGKVAATVNLSDSIENQLVYYVKEKGIRHLKLELHPYVSAFLTKGFPSLLLRWKYKYNCRLKLIPSNSCPMLQVKWSDQNGVCLDIL